jgi:hypothetical protein
MVNETSAIAGEPDVFVKRCQQYKDLGADEVVFRLDGNHEEIMRSIKMIGKYVIPRFKMAASVVAFNDLMSPVP